MFSWEDNHRSKGQFASHLIKVTNCLHDSSLLTLNSITWLKECLLSSFTVESHPFPVSPPYTLGGKPLYAAHPYGVGRYAASFWGQVCFHTLLGILDRNLPLLPIYLVNDFITLTWTHGYFFYTLGHNSISFYSLRCLNCSSCGHWELFLLVPVSIWHTFLIMGFFKKGFPIFWH